MRFTSVLLTVGVAVLVQMVFSRFAIAGNWPFDLVLVGVMFAALLWGPVAGMISGTLGGLLQDVASGGIVGVNGLSKTLVGFVGGFVGAQFVISKPGAQTAIVAGATIIHRVIVIALSAVIDQQWPGLSWSALLWETGINAIAGFAAFQGAEALPHAVSRGRGRSRSSLSRRQW